MPNEVHYTYQILDIRQVKSRQCTWGEIYMYLVGIQCVTIGLSPRDDVRLGIKTKCIVVFSHIYLYIYIYFFIIPSIVFLLLIKCSK